MARTLLTWRWAGLTLVLVAAVVGMVELGRWQWDRSVPEPERAAVDLASVRAADLPDVVDLAGTSGAAVPDGQEGGLVAATGTWRPERTLLVADRELDGREGRWVVTGLEVAAPDGGTALLPVVRGWLPAAPGDPAADVPAPTTAPTAGAEVDVVGWLQQSEALDIPAEILQPEGVVPLLASADLANRWPEDLVPGFVVLAPTPAQVGASDLALLPSPPAEETSARDWRNLAYSAQWFVFAGFAVVLWWRMLRDDTARGRHDPDDPDDPSTPDPQAPDPGPRRERSTA